jgi:DNA-binding transcriptional ArsR family regulator
MGTAIPGSVVPCHDRDCGSGILKRPQQRPMDIRVSVEPELMTPCRLGMNDKMLDLVAGRFHTLGEPYRLGILQVLTPGAMSVGELVKELEGNQSNVSKRPFLLHQAGIVNRRRAGKSIIYSLNDPAVFRLCELVHRNETEKKRVHGVGGLLCARQETMSLRSEGPC